MSKWRFSEVSRKNAVDKREVNLFSEIFTIASGGDFYTSQRPGLMICARGGSIKLWAKTQGVHA